jgi:hypothetical protein
MTGATSSHHFPKAKDTHVTNPMARNLFLAPLLAGVLLSGCVSLSA